MFQSFAAPPPGTGARERVLRVRAAMARGGLDALVVPRADEHQGEYVPACAERLAWLTGFTGSAGLAVLARAAGALFVDGRYVTQAPRQIDTAIFEVMRTPSAKIEDWLGTNLKRGAVVGVDARLISANMAEELGTALAHRGMRLKLMRHNLVDRVWGRARPAPPTGEVVVHPLKYAGKPAQEKLEELQAALRADGQDAVILTLPDSIAWLFNIRGSDVAHTPVALAFAFVPANGRPDLFLAATKLGPEARRHLAGLGNVREPAALERRLAALKATRKTIRLDPNTAAVAFFRRLAGGKARIKRAPDPCLVPKARKNPVEIKGAQIAHRRDGAAIVRHLAWLDRQAARGELDEIAVVRELEAMRSATQALKEIAFDTICGAGANGAIVHYRVTTASNRKLKPGELLLIDSGAQYLEGTTDVTRTIAIGEPTRQMQERFTLVLKGHIAMATARFPKGTRGIELDAFARRALWQAGLDFDHGTGHGVGSYLAVHEGPQTISRRGMAVLEPGMIVSNEPGYYQEGAYGIRIENLLLVKEGEMLPGGEREMLSFETLTLAPIDRRLVLADCLAREERDWLNCYHARVAGALAPELAPEDRAWLARATAPIGAD